MLPEHHARPVAAAQTARSDAGAARARRPSTSGRAGKAELGALSLVVKDRNGLQGAGEPEQLKTGYFQPKNPSYYKHLWT